VLDGVRFVGTTLWSDFDALADHENSTDLTRSLKLRDKAFRAANFYLRKTGGNARWRALSGRAGAHAGAAVPAMVA
jgi:hypothetical protein